MTGLFGVITLGTTYTFLPSAPSRILLVRSREIAAPAAQAAALAFKKSLRFIAGIFFCFFITVSLLYL
jgi:hypothetical protein